MSFASTMISNCCHCCCRATASAGGSAMGRRCTRIKQCQVGQRYIFWYYSSSSTHSTSSKRFSVLLPNATTNPLQVKDHHSTTSITNIYRKEIQQQRKRRRFVSFSTTTTTERIITTEDGVIIHQGDPSKSAESGLGLVWGSVLWPAGICLSKFVSSQKGYQMLFQNHKRRRILELGCGTGIVGLTLAKLYSSGSDQHSVEHVTLSDFESSLWPLLRKSIQSNKISNDCISIETVDWKDPDTFLMLTNKMRPRLQQQHDLVVAADVLYAGMDKLFARALASHIPSVEEMTAAGDAGDLSSNNNSTVEAIVACPFRTDSPLLGFFEACQRLGLTCERLENSLGQAVGAAAASASTASAGSSSNVKNDVAFEDCQFVSISIKQTQIATEPTFSIHNTNQIQIFRITRVSGFASDAANIRRLARI